MRRWNGWGDESRRYPVPDGAREFLTERLGPGRPLRDAQLEDVLARVPASRLPEHDLLHTDAETRLRHARGQSLPDCLALRSGEVGVFPDAVAFPASAAQVRELLQAAESLDALVIPWGGGTSVAGHVTPPAAQRPVITVDMGRMNQLIDLDPVSQIATFGAGTPGPQVEAQLRAHGFMLGHFPQSWELSTLGGWVATRSSGQQSLRYGRIEQLFAGGRVESPAGTLEIPAFPASSAGPDLRELFMGTEGRAGIITEVRVRITPMSERETFHVAFFPDWSSGMEAVREMVQARIPLSMLRLSDAAETDTQLRLAGGGRALRWLERYLAWRGARAGRCMLTFGITDSAVQSRAAFAQARAVLRRKRAVYLGTGLGRRWEHSRFRSPYLRDSLWELGYAVDTLETAVNWHAVPATVDAVERALGDGLRDEGEAVHAFSHLSHVYRQGSSIYTTYLFRAGADHAATLERWRRLKAAASAAVVAQGGTISHQHGVGTDHARYLPAEKGELGMAAIRALCRGFDPAGRMNPGKLFPTGGEDPAP